MTKLVHDIAAAAFVDNGTQLSYDDISAALDADRGAGFLDPTADEVTLLISGDDDGKPPPALCAEHPALSMLLEAAMT